MFDCWQVVSGDRRESLVTFVQVLTRANYRSRRILLKGLSKDTRYEVHTLSARGEEEGDIQIRGGDTLMSAGILVPDMPGDFRSKLIYLTAAD